jgi:hypothetical protein
MLKFRRKSQLNRKSENEMIALVDTENHFSDQSAAYPTSSPGILFPSRLLESHFGKKFINFEGVSKF